MPEQSVETLVQAAQSFMHRSFPTVQANPDYTAIISPRHFERLVMLLDDARRKGATVISLAPEGEADFDAATRKIAPHLLLDVNDSMLIMQEEIFGPLLPVKTFTQSDEALAWINAHPRPLAAYYFGNNAASQATFITNTTSGAVVINDVMTHAALDGLPFGGVGASGMGAYHGIHGFRRFSHQKPVVVQNADGESNLRLRAPYQDKTASIVAFLQG
ncbi:Coniferyl aldehyde dehydrogenase [compost metagenome]